MLTHPNFLGPHATGRCPTVVAEAPAMSTGSAETVEGRVQAAFDAVPRAPFLPRRKRRYAGDDRPIEIGHGQTNSQPRTVRAMLELLDVAIRGTACSTSDAVRDGPPRCSPPSPGPTVPWSASRSSGTRRPGAAQPP